VDTVVWLTATGTGTEAFEGTLNRVAVLTAYAPLLLDGPNKSFRVLDVLDVLFVFVVLFVRAVLFVLVDAPEPEPEPEPVVVRDKGCVGDFMLPLFLSAVFPLVGGRTRAPGPTLVACVAVGMNRAS
jgi:hypothetical protein